VNGNLNDVITAFNEYYDANLSLEEDIDNTTTLPDIDYIGKPYVLTAKEDSLAYQGTIELLVRYPSEQLNDVIVVTAYKGLTYPATELDGTVELLTPSGSAIFIANANVINNELFFYGGFTTASQRSLHRYNFVTDSWTTSTTPIPKDMTASASAVVDDKIYVFGDTGTEGSIPIYDPETDSWVDAPIVLPTAMAYAKAVTVGRDIYLFGSNAALGQLWRYNVDSATITRLADGPTLSGGGMCYHDGKIFYVGGFRNTVYSASTHSYDIASDTWSELAS